MRIIFLILFFYTLIISHQIWATCDLMFIQEHKNNALSFLETGQNDSLNHHEEKIVECFIKQDDLISLIRYQREKAELLLKMGKVNEAIEAFEKATSNSICFRDPITDEEFKSVAWAYAATGYAWKEKNNHRAVIEKYEKAASVFVDTLGIEDYLVGRFIYGQLGNAYNRLRDYERAEYYQKRRLFLCEKEEKLNAAADASNDLGMVYLNMREFEHAIETLKRGLELNPEKFTTKCLLLMNLADAYYKVDNLDQLIFFNELLEETLKSSHLSEVEINEYVFWLNINYGNYYKEEDYFDQSESYYSKAISIAKKNNFLDKRPIALALIYRANLFLKSNNFIKSLKDFHAAIKIFLPSFDESDIYSLPTISQLELEPNLLEIFRGLSKCFTYLYQHKQNRGYKEKAYLCLDLATELDIMLKNEYILQGSDAISIWKNRWINSEKLNMLYYQFNESRKTSDYNNMFLISDKSRSNHLLEGIYTYLLITSDSLDNYKLRYNEINDALSKLENLKFEQIKSSDESEIEKEINNLKLQRNKLLRSLQPQRLDLTNQPDIEIEEEYLMSIHPNQSLLQYFIQDTTAFLFVISPKLENIQIKKLEWNQAWTDMANTIKDDIFYQNDTAYLRKAMALYDHLIKPALEMANADRLIIVPDGELWNVPFDALLTKDIPASEIGNFKKYSYLIDSVSISYAFSASLLHEMTNRKKKNKGNGLLAFAPEYKEPEKELFADNFGYKNALNPLVFSIPESEAVVNMVGGMPWFGREATKANFLQYAGEADILHISGHAKANVDEPNFSYIAFSNMVDSSFKLYVHELYNHPMPASMVVLSACETGTGPVWKGEGSISIARAFAYSGAQSIVTTLWSVEEKPAMDISVNFYKYLKKGMSKDKALQQAKMDYINYPLDNDRAHPRYWAAFTVVGSVEPLFMPVWQKWLIAILVMGVAVGLFFYFKQQREHG